MRPIESVTAAIKTAAVAVALCSGASAKAAFIPVDLTTFTADAPVSVAADGSSATFIESPSLGRVTLSSDLLLPGSLSDLGCSYCAGGIAAHFSDPFRQIATAILLKRSKN